jgi:hypothetical protein
MTGGAFLWVWRVVLSAVSQQVAALLAIEPDPCFMNTRLRHRIELFAIWVASGFAVFATSLDAAV